jgi:DNA-binding response OmpR family regulator
MSKILLVDDDPNIHKVLQHVLMKDGHELTSALTGEDALSEIRSHKPDIMVLDLMLPGISGLEVLNELALLTESFPVIILSAKGDETDRIVGFRMGVDDYIAKPFNPIELALRVKAVLRRFGGAEKAEQGAERIEIDSGRREVVVRGVVTALTTKEFDLLLLLTRHPRQVFTRRQLLNHVWQSDYEGDEMTVTVHIRRLREKIEEFPSEPAHIITVWGVGYKFLP